jgi:hypothetical protein
MRNTSTATLPFRSILLITACLFFLIGGRSVQAQYRASLQGTVADPSGAIVPGATVTLTNTETNFSQKVTTNDSGVYSISGLAPGVYKLTVEKNGFTKQEMNNVQITSEQAQSQNVQLQMAAQTTQTVTVTAGSSPAINTENANVAGTLTGQEIRNLPTFGDDPFQAVALAPGTFGDNERASSGGGSQNLPGNAGPGGTSGTSSIFQTENQVQAVANGTRTENNDFQIDGVEVNSLAWGGAAVITPNEESVKEVTVESNPYDAENGRNSGAQVLVVSKNGTNEFHGSAMAQGQRPGLNAYQRWNGPNGAPVQRDTDRFNQFAGSLGGPIIKNKLFFFFSYETLRNDSSSLSQGWYETPQFDSLIASLNPASIASKITGYPGEGAAYNAIVPYTCAQAGFSPGACAPVFSSSGQYQGLDIGSPLRSGLGTSDPSYHGSGTPGIGGGLDGIPDIFYVQTSSPTINNPQQYNGRVDFQLTSRDRITFSTYYVPNDQTSYNGAARSANLWHSNRLNESAALIWDHTISPSWLNEARFNVTRWHFNEIASNPQEPFGLPMDQVDQLAGASIENNPFGAPGPGVFVQTTYNYRDTVSTIIGNHSLKFGVDIYNEQDGDSLTGQARPEYFFRNLWDFANDAPYQEVGNFNPLTGQPTSATKYIRSAIYAGFIQDDWKVTPTLTLNLGLRWEFFKPVTEKYGNISNVILGNGPDPLTGARIKLGGQLYNSDYGNYGPQFGFAWNPYPTSQRFVVRGGFGIGYNRMEEAITLNGRANPPLVTGFTLSAPNIVYAVPSNVHQFSGWPVNPNALQSFSPTTGLPTSGAAITLNGFPENLVTPRTYRYSLMTETNLGASWVGTLGYQGSLSRHLTLQNNLNLLYAPLNPQVSNLYWFENDGNASYNAMLAEISHSFAKQFQFDAQYRWANNIDEGSNSYSIGEYPYGLQYRRGPADFDVRHNVKMYGVWSPDLFKGHGLASKLLGGWQISGIFNWHTGFPWTPIYSNYGCNLVYNNSGYCNLRPQGYLGGMGYDYSNSTFQRPYGNFPGGGLNYFTLPAYSITTGGIPPVPGVGRNSLRGPNYLDTDATIQKSFGLPKMPVFGENARLTLRGDLFNIFNKLNLTPLSANSIDEQVSLNGTTSNPLFGEAQSALGARVVSLQARFEF